MKSLWPNLFAFLIILLLLLYAYDPAFIQAALIFLGAWFVMVFYGLLFVAVAGLALIGFLAYQRHMQRANLPVDGAYPLQRFRTRDGRTVVVNPTHMVGAAAVIDRRAGTYTEVEHPAGWGVVADVRHAIERSNTVRAMFPGDQARMNANGAMSQVPRMPNFKQLEAKAPTPPPRIIGESPPALPAPAPPALALPDVIRQSTPERWIIGQSPDNRSLATLDLRKSIHVGVIGATGTGTTASLGFLVAAHAIRSGYHVVILDPKGGADWRPWQQVAEWHEADRSTFGDQVRAVEAEHERRLVAVRRAEVSAVMALPNPPRPVLVVIEEYGDLIAQMRQAKGGDAAQVDAILDRLLRLSRMTDIHLLMIDQYPEHWSNQVMAGTKAKAIFQLGPNQGAKVAEYHADKLSDVGRYLLKGKEYNAWHAAPDLGAILRGLPVRTGADVVGVGYTVGEGVRGSGDDGVVVNRDIEAVRGARTNEPAEPASKWDDVTAAFFTQRPELLTGPARGIVDLARAMAEADGGIKPHTAYKGIAHTYFHAFRNNVRLPSGAPLGVDVTIGPQ